MPDNAEILKLLINEGAKINCTNANGCTPLHLAVSTKNETATTLLLESLATPDAEDNFRNTPLHIAAEQGFSELAELLLIHGAKPNTPRLNGFTPLHLACLHARADTVAVLLKHNADPNVSSDEGTPLDLAYPERGPIEFLDARIAIVTKLLEAGALLNGFDNSGKSVLHRAVERNCLEMVAATVKHSNINAVSLDVAAKYLLSPIQIAALNGFLEIGELLISHGADLNMPCNISLGGNYTPLHLACSYGHVDFVEMLLKNKADPEARSLEGRTPLLAAICHLEGNTDIQCGMTMVQLLVGSGASLMTSDQEGTTVLHADAYKQGLSFTRMILEMIPNDKVLINKPTITGLTPLHVAAAKGSVKLVEFLLDHGADINFVSNTPTSDGLSPLHVASKHAHMNVVKLLLCRGADANSMTSLNQTPAHVMLSVPDNFFNRHLQNGVTVLSLLLENLADIDCIDKNGHSVLNLGVKLRRLPVVETILGYKPDPERTVNRSSLRIAVISRTEVSDEVFSDFSYKLRTDAVKEVKTIIQTLLDYGIVFNKKDVTGDCVLHHAIRKGLSNAVQHLLDRGADFRALSDSGTPLHSAVKALQLDTVKLLISMGADVNAKDKEGRMPIFYVVVKEMMTKRPALRDSGDSQMCSNVARELLLGGADLSSDSNFLMIAIQKRDEELVKLALERNANVDVVEPNGFTSLHMAIHMKHENLVKLLLDHGVKIEARDMIEQTPLHKAVYSRQEGIAMILLDKGADVGVSDGRGYTPLHHAAVWGRVPIIARLLELGAHTEVCNNKSLTPLLVAAENGHGPAVVALLRGGANPKAQRPDGTTVMHLTAERTDEWTVEAVLHYGAEVTARTCLGATPLWSAICYGKPKNAKILFDCGGYTRDMCCSLLRFDRWSMKLRFEETAELHDILHQHLLSVEALQLWNENCRSGCRTSFIHKLANDFAAELKTIKSKTLITNMTFFDIISKPKNQLVSVARNETIVKGLAKIDFTKQFPTWGRLLHQRWTSVVTREKLLSSAISSFNALIVEAVLECIRSEQAPFPEALKTSGFGWILQVLRAKEVSAMSEEGFRQYLLQIHSLLPVAVVEKILRLLTDGELQQLNNAPSVSSLTSPPG